MKSTDWFLPAVQRAWGNPIAVADAGMNELFRHDVGLDSDDQVNRAIEIGVLAGQMAEKTPEEFVVAFEEKMLTS